MNDEGINWLEWLWFHENADFGTADGDVRHIMMENYEEETGNVCPAREEDDE